MKKTIVIVDDSELFRTQMGGLLAAHGYETLQFATVQEFKESGTIDRADTILLDVDLPGMSGPEFLREMVDGGVLRKIPLILISATSDDGILKEFKPLLEKGSILAMDFFRKDRFNYDVLAFKLHSMLKLRDFAQKEE